MQTRQNIKEISKFFSFLFLFLFLGFAQENSFCAYANTGSLASDKMPVKVNSDDMVYDMEKNTVDFTGNVVVVRGDFILKSEKMTIFMLKKEEKSTSTIPQENNTRVAPNSTPLTGRKAEPLPSVQDENNIEKIIASQGVTFTYGTQSGESESAVYHAKTGVLTMHGNPIVRDGDSQIQGETIRYYMNEKRSEVVGTEKKRVEAIFKN